MMTMIMIVMMINNVDCVCGNYALEIVEVCRGFQNIDDGFVLLLGCTSSYT